MGFKIDELYYELDARTAGFENRITHAQTSLGNFADFIRDKPMLAVAALGASILAVGAAATKMASDVDTSVRRVQAAFPGATGEIDKLRRALAQLSTESPRSQKELADAAATIAEKGVGSVDELIGRLRVSTLVADATGASLETVADGLDNIADAFRLTSKQAEDALTTIFGFTQGKVAIGDVFQTLARGGAILADLNVRAEDAGQAMVALIDAGVPRRQAGTVLTTILELTNRVKELRRGTESQGAAADIIERTLSRQNITQKGFIASLGELATGLEKAGIDTRELGIRSNTLTAITRVAATATEDHRTAAEKLADAQDRLQKSADTNRTSAHALSEILKNELAETFIRLGNKILPTVISLLEKTADVMARIRGEGNPLKDIKLLQGVVPTGELPEDRGLSGSAFRKGTKYETDEERSVRAFNRAFEAAGTRAERYGADAFSGLTPAELQKMLDNVKAWIAAHPRNTAAGGGLWKSDQAGSNRDTALFLAISEALKAAAAEAAAETAGAGTGGAGPKPPPELEKSVRDAIRALRAGVNDALANATQTEIDDAQLKVVKFRAEVAALEKQARQKLPDLRAEVERLANEPARVEAKERAQAALSVADEVARALGVQSIAMQQALADFNTEVAKRNAEYAKLGKAPLFTDDQIQQVRSVREALISATQAAEQTDAVLSRIRAQETARRPLTASSAQSERLAEQGFNVASSIELQAELAKRRNELAEVAGKTDAASKAKSKALLEQISTLQAKINELEGRNRVITNDINAALLRRIALLEQTAEAIGAAVNLASQLASAFGESGQRIASIITGIGAIGQAAASVKPFMESLKVFKSGAKDEAGNPLMSLGSLIGKAMPIIGGITAAVGLASQLLGGDPREKQARADNIAAMQQLRRALTELKDAYLQNVSTEQAQSDIDAIKKLLGQVGTGQFGQQTFAGQTIGPDKSGGGPGSRGTLRAIGRSLGYDYDSGALLAYFQDFDKRYGTNFAQFIERQAPSGLLQAIANAPDAIKKAMENLGRYSDDVAGVIEQVNFQFAVLGKTDAVEKFKAIIDGIRAAGIDLGDFAGTFATLNDTSSTAEQRQQAIDDALQKILTGTGVNYGGLTPEQVRELLKQAADAYRGATPGTGGFNVDRTITEVTGQRMQALIVTSNTFLEQIAANTAAIASVFGVGPVLPPILPPTVGMNGASAGDTYYVTISLEGANISGDPTDVGDRLGAAFTKRINKGLGREAKIKVLMTGQPLKA